MLKLGMFNKADGAGWLEAGNRSNQYSVVSDQKQEKAEQVEWRPEVSDSYSVVIPYVTVNKQTL